MDALPQRSQGPDMNQKYRAASISTSCGHWQKISFSNARSIKAFSAGTILYAFGIGTAFLAHVAQTSNITSSSVSFENMIYFTFGSAAIAGLGIAVLISIVLYKTVSHPGTKRCTKVINHLVLFFIGTGLLTTVCAIITISVYASTSSSIVYLAIQFSIPRLYANSIIALFNSKSRLKEKMDVSLDLRVASSLFFGAGDPQVVYQEQ